MSKSELGPGSDVPEWILLELQGDIESRNQEEMKGKFIGDLHFTKEGTPILIIGHHLLYGKLMDMEKPIVAIKKDRSTQTEEKVDYTIEAIMKKRLLFKTRPKPIILTPSS